MSISLPRYLGGFLTAVSVVVSSASMASAETVYMVQLGSFESEGQAKSHWDKVHQRFPDLFSPLNYKAAEVTLPPDDFVYHRTQAGPVSTRSEAEEICDDLLVAGFECYVVETAMVNSSAVPVAMNKKTAPKNVTAKVADVAKAATNKVVAAIPAPVVATKAAASASLSDAADSLDALLAEEDMNFAKDDFYASKRAESVAKEISIPKLPKKADVKKEVAKVVVEPKVAAKAPTKLAVPKFTPVIPKITAPTVAAKAVAVPVIAPKIDTPIVKPAKVAVKQNPWEDAVKAEFSKKKPVVDDTYSPSKNKEVAKPFQVGESKDHLKKKIARGDNAIEVGQPPVIKSVESGKSKVKVSEAVRVPLSLDPNLKPAPLTSPIRRFKGTPSQPSRKSSLWAEISYFKNQNAALNYWGVIRGRQAGIANNLRLRVTRPFMGRGTAKKVSLRVGPFSNVDAIRKLCSVTRPEGLRCRAVKDMGASVAMRKAARKRYSAADRYKMREHSARRALNVSGAKAFWLHLGVYDSPVAAKMGWDELKSMHSKELSSLRELISTPHFSSSYSKKYRLRAGPFARSADAISSCESLKRRGERCVVVSGR